MEFTEKNMYNNFKKLSRLICRFCLLRVIYAHIPSEKRGTTVLITDDFMLPADDAVSVCLYQHIHD